MQNVNDAFQKSFDRSWKTDSISPLYQLHFLHDTNLLKLWEDLLEKEKATHSSMLAWRIPWTEEPGGLTVHGVAESQT